MKSVRALEEKYKIVLAALLLNLLSMFRRFTKDPQRYWKFWNELFDFQCFVEAHFDGYRIYLSREKLWKRMLLQLPNEFSGVEFGVAKGYLTNYWIGKSGKRLKSWDGFDTFTGLPRAWRDLPQGTFHAGGNVPPIVDERINWHVGLVEDTLNPTTLLKSTTKRCYFFDLDLFEPSLFVWNVIKTQLQEGDILYFDEAFDADERQLLLNHVLPWGKFELIGVTPLALAVKFIGAN